MTDTVTASCCKDANAESLPPPQTIGEVLDQRIANCRERLERLCITKAKAEAAQILNVPVEFCEQVCFG